MRLIKKLRLFLPLLTFSLVVFAGFHAAHAHGQVQSGWMMVCMFALVLTIATAGIELIHFDWFATAITVVCLICALAFAVHYLGGDQGVAELQHWLSWIYQKISRVYVDTFY